MLLCGRKNPTDRPLSSRLSQAAGRLRESLKWPTQWPNGLRWRAAEIHEQLTAYRAAGTRDISEAKGIAENLFVLTFHVYAALRDETRTGPPRDASNGHT